MYPCRVYPELRFWHDFQRKALLGVGGFLVNRRGVIMVGISIAVVLVLALNWAVRGENLDGEYLNREKGI
jgi:hypothetical protein